MTNKTLNFLVIVGAVVTAVLLGKKTSAEPNLPPTGYSNLYGKVADSVTKQPLSGVLVVLDGPIAPVPITQTSTGNNGSYQFLNILPGTYNVEFSKPGYQTVVL